VKSEHLTSECRPPIGPNGQYIIPSCYLDNEPPNCTQWESASRELTLTGSNCLIKICYLIRCCNHLNPQCDKQACQIYIYSIGFVNEDEHDPNQPCETYVRCIWPYYYERNINEPAIKSIIDPNCAMQFYKDCYKQLMDVLFLERLPEMGSEFYCQGNPCIPNIDCSPITFQFAMPKCTQMCYIGTDNSHEGWPIIYYTGCPMENSTCCVYNRQYCWCPEPSPGHMVTFEEWTTMYVNCEGVVPNMCPYDPDAINYGCIEMCP